MRIQCGRFWAHIAAYYAASLKLAGADKRESTHCKQRWQKINEHVCKFVGSYEAPTRQRASGQNEDDVMKLAYQIFSNDYKIKFTLEHAWREFRHDQKWIASLTKGTAGTKRRKCNDGSAQDTSSKGKTHGEDESLSRSPGVKAAKGKGKKKNNTTSTTNTCDEQKALLEFQMLELQRMYEIKGFCFAKEGFCYA
ncbi:PREDICTED: glutathione S-transferase T2-like [Camelina sativa]|uniref:Glutathione S-transferase T2-like n=1 Tax=Camelina sativa TaxID=90675 RepID=A0ABM0T4J9_CAMSA|nr:PREDICTED: glutathione S-transferase T2-like [Camelina sativa]